MSAIQILERDARLVEAYLRQATSAARTAGASPARLFDAIEHSLFAGGKRLRPALAIECATACGAEASDRAVLACAGAIELVHTFSLVHDDLPAMDDDDLRRGRPTCHKVFGEALAILAGDAMMTLAFDLIARDAPGSLVPVLVGELARAAGPVGMIGGQVRDLDGEDRLLPHDELITVHQMKTGALLRCSCRCGALCAGASEAQLAAVTQFGESLGLAFQIVDDLLDVTSTPEKLGKRTHKDDSRGKNTYVSTLGVSGARDAAQVQLASAIEAIAPFGPEADSLRTLARFVIDRNR